MKLPQKRNLQKELDELLPSLDGGVLLHCCCAACSTSCLEYLVPRIKDLSLYYYNPNIDTQEEYELRARELLRFNREVGYNLHVAVAKYDPDEFYNAVKGLEHTGEGGERCKKCFSLRLSAAAEEARKQGKKYVLTTLSVSPHKDAELLYEIGQTESSKRNIVFLPSDFKKNGGFIRGGEICKTYGIYRQNYCGCIFSKNERNNRQED